MRPFNAQAMKYHRGFTLIEVMIVIALVAVVVSLAGPSFRDYILMQRLRSVQSQLVTDLNYARSEAVSRGVPVQMRMQTSTDQTCYIIYSRPSNDLDITSPCDCTAAAGSRCPASSMIRSCRISTRACASPRSIYANLLSMAVTNLLCWPIDLQLSRIVARHFLEYQRSRF